MAATEPAIATVPMAPETITPPRAKPLLEINHLTKSFDGTNAVDDLSLTIYQGEIFALLGASGCGKSTLLRMLAGFETPNQGQVLLEGQDLVSIAPYQRPVNMMFQSYALFPQMSVWDNIAFGLKQDKLPKAQIKQRVEEMLELVHMRDYAQRKPHQLSGGQRQRVALARSLAKRPKLLLLDEPMGALDKKLREQMQLEVVDILEKVGVTCVMVTHDQEEAMTMAGRLAIMEKGRLVQVGKPQEIYESPNCRMSAEFIGSVNLFEGQLLEHDGRQIRTSAFARPIKVEPPINASAERDLTVAVRPEKIRLSRTPDPNADNRCEGTVEDIAYLGGQSVYHVRLPSGVKVLATQPNVQRVGLERLTWDDKVHLSWHADANVVLSL